MSRIIVISFIFVVACNSREPANTADVAIKEDTITELRYVAKTPLTLPGCYSMIAGRDTATLKLNVAENQVTGNLKYKLREKDSNTGTLTGVIKDSLIVATYTFQSEGMSSEREVVFKIEGNSLIEGFGELNTNGGTIKYKNKAKLQFHNNHLFVKGACLE